MKGSLRRRDRRENSNAGPERWELRVFLGRDDAGRQRHAYRSFSGTKREAESALATFLTDIQRRQRPTSSKVRFGEYAKQWLAFREVAGEIEASTLQRYQGIVRDHLLPPSRLGSASNNLRCRCARSAGHLADDTAPGSEESGSEREVNTRSFP